MGKFEKLKVPQYSSHNGGKVWKKLKVLQYMPSQGGKFEKRKVPQCLYVLGILGVEKSWEQNFGDVWTQSTPVQSPHTEGKFEKTAILPVQYKSHTVEDFEFFKLSPSLGLVLY